ncbi:MAG: EAL domain-containing protein [Methylophilaceae bacterium]|nr:EAL domain-containing protein [Methyloradius sp.]
MALMNHLVLRRLLLIVAVYFITGKAGLLLPSIAPNVTLIWLPSGIAVAVLMRWGYQCWPAIMIGAFLVDGSQSAFAHPWAYVSIAVGSTLSPFITTWILRYFKFSGKLSHIKDIALMAFAGLAGTLVAATIGVASLVSAGIFPQESASQNWLVWWAGDTMGVLLVLPTLLNFSKNKLNQLCRERGKFILSAVFTFLLQLVIFKFVPTVSAQFMLLAFLLLPMVMWVTMRFGLMGASILVLGISIIAISTAANASGPFSHANPHQTAIELWVFMSTLSLVVLMISALRAEWDAIEQAMLSSEIKLRAVIDGALDAIVTIDENGHLQEFNPAAERIFGYTREQVIGRPLAEVIIPPAQRHAHAIGHRKFIATGKKNIFNKRLEMNAIRADGSEFPVELTITSVDNMGLPLVTGFIRDITERKQAEQEIRNLAFFDALTGLPNRRLLQDRLEQALVSSGRTLQYGAVIFIDLDNFKALNDTRGHALGDILLIEIARRLSECVRADDTVARLGGDEFVLVLENLSDDLTQSIAQAKLLAEKIQATINQPYYLQEIEHHHTSSIGISLFQGVDIAAQELLKRSDTAMYQAKSAGRNTFVFFDPNMQAALEKRSRIEAEMRKALVQHEFEVYYQPQVDEQSRIIGAELLIRWMQPEHGLVMPMEFIPLAEETSLIIPIGHWVLRQACEQLKVWQSRPEKQQLTLSVNVSAVQFRQASFVDDVAAMLVETGISPSLLKLELTESTVLDNLNDTVRKMMALRAIGVRLSMDDFGTGYSSLAYLKQLPFSQVKIDKSFVRDIVEDANDAAIVQAIVAISKSLEINVIAEGVETKSQLDFLVEYGCRQFQGYFFARPLPLNEFEQFFHKTNQAE